MPSRRKPLNVRVADAFFHRLPLPWVDNDIAIAIHPHRRDIDLPEHGSQVSPTQRCNRTQERFDGGAREITVHHSCKALIPTNERGSDLYAKTKSSHHVEKHKSNRTITCPFERQCKR